MANSTRKTSKGSLGSQGPQGVCPNGAYYSSGLSNPHFAAMASSQNLPAVLNDPRKGKQKDFFTRSWGEDFTELKPIPSSPFVCHLPEQTFDKYLRKLRKHCSRHTVKISSTANQSKPSSPIKSSTSSNLSSVPAIFLDPNFDLNEKDTFEKIFPFLLGDKKANDESGAAHFCKKIESNGRLAQERLSHHLDEVEVKIAEQVAQKSHHFFQIMTHHDALINQLSGLVKRVEKLRNCLQDTDKNVYQVGLDVCRLRRRHKNANLVLTLLNLMSSLHQTQPTVQILLSGNEFSGALDLISTSRDILSVDLQGVTSFRHLSSQLLEIHAVIGKILLTDFQTYISSEIVRDAKHIRASVLTETSSEDLGEAECEHLTSVIFGLLRQNSFTFLDVLDNASTLAVKNTIRDVSDELIQRSRNEMALTMVAAEFAQYATSLEWVDFFDVLLGSLIYLLRRIHSIHNVISEAVNKTVQSNSSLAIPEQQLATLKFNSRDVLINVCDQVVERSSKILAQRSKTIAAKHITTKELKDLGKLVDILTYETFCMTGKVCSGLQLSLQSQSLMFMQAFDEEKRQCLTTLLEQENWKKSEMDISRTLVKFEQLPHFLEVFSNEEIFNDVVLRSDPDSSDPSNRQIQNNNNHKETQLVPGDIRINGKTYSVFDCAHFFLAILAEYCDLCTTLPSVTIELGLRAAEIIKLYNSRLCQFILGGAALTVANLKTITIRNLALAKQSLYIIMDFIPHVRAHFENCYVLKKSQLNFAKATDFSSPSNAESKQLEALQRQFDQANKHLADHVDELEKKILGVIENILHHHLAKWTASSASLPSANFKSLCKQLVKLHESVNDIWPAEQTILLLSSVHRLFVESVRYEIRQRKILDPESPQGRLLMSELTFYGQSLKRLNVIPEDKLQREALERIWEDL